MRNMKSIIFSLGFGIVFLIIGTIILITKPHDVMIQKVLETKIPLLNDTMGFNIWKKIVLEFKVYIFHVVNPNEVQNNGDVAILVEHGPYVYDVHLERIIIGVNDADDTIEYIARRYLFFNATKSGNYSEEDELTILNAAYLGTILTIAGKFPPFVASLGNNIPLLFPDSKSLFVRGKVKNILFDGLPLICDTAAHPELGMICGVLKSHRPPIVRLISDDGVYAYSFFHKMNGTNDGPYTISRGVKDFFSVGHISEFKGLPYADYWTIKNCSITKGTDSIFYPPMRNRETEIFTFASDLCRSVHIQYVGDKVYNGLLGYHYKTTKNLWNGSDSSCYCPRSPDGKMMCPLPGMLDLEKCQGAPVIMTEPHFLHGASDLFSITEGLRPDEDKHAAYVVVEPLTGTPLSGSRKMQLNMMLKQLPVNLLSNVSQGLFPMAWVDEGLTPKVKMLEPIHLIHRINQVLKFLAWIPFIFGAIIVLYTYWVNTVTKTGPKTSGRITILAPKNTPK